MLHNDRVFIRDFFKTLENFTSMMSCMGCCREQDLLWLEFSCWVQVDHVGLEWASCGRVLGRHVSLIAFELRAGIKASFFFDADEFDRIHWSSKVFFSLGCNDLVWAWVVTQLALHNVWRSVDCRFSISETFIFDWLFLLNFDIKFDDMRWRFDWLIGELSCFLRLRFGQICRHSLETRLYLAFGRWLGYWCYCRLDRLFLDNFCLGSRHRWAEAHCLIDICIFVRSCYIFVANSEWHRSDCFGSICSLGLFSRRIHHHHVSDWKVASSWPIFLKILLFSDGCLFLG